jgi:hypothetical protein
MSKNKREKETVEPGISPADGVGVVGEQMVEPMGSTEELPGVDSSDPLFQIYCALLGSVDWLRDPRTRPQTICRACLRDAKIALDFYKKNQGGIES